MSGLRVELGSGYSPTPGFVHIDANPNAPQVDVVWDDMTSLPFYEDGQVDEIRAVDVLEHCSYRDTATILDEWARVLKPGGTVYVQVPDAASIMRWYERGDGRLCERIPAELPQDMITGAAWRLLGGHMDGQSVRDGDDFRWNAHFALFSPDSLRRALVAAGFEIVSSMVNGHPNVCVTAARL